ncbi:MAG TPA: hypothetical protein VHU87_12690 [Rhizomicrobium sp.]|jgi:4-amino-4-deoxy-L-arabinose transferase-like glycosyltransferase|nr:hypothetical protein [Rhizomicrobium sp.]
MAFTIRPRWIAAAMLVAGFAAALAVNWPGHLEFDSINQLAEGRFGSYSNWHPPIMSWLLGIADAISPGAAAFVAFDAAMAFGAILSLLWVVKRPTWPAVIAAAVVVVLPQLFLFQAIVWKDILFADACVAGFVCLAHAAARWESPRARFAWLGAATVFTALAVLTRQNGFVILPCAATALGWIAAPGWRRALAYGAGFFAVTLVLVLGVNALLQDNYATPLMGTPALSHPFFAVIGLVALVLLLRRRRPADLAMAGLLAATMLYTLSYFVISIACEYRYLFALDLSVIAAAFYLIADVTRRPAPSA